MSRETRYALYAFGAVLMVGALVLAFLPVTVSDVIAVDCGAPAAQSGLVALTPKCVPALEVRALWAWLVAIGGLGVLAVAGFLSYRSVVEQSAA